MVNGFYPQNLAEALEIIDSNSCIVMAGATDLMVRRKMPAGIAADFPKPPIFIKSVKELSNIVFSSDTISIGSCVTLSDLVNNEQIPLDLGLASSQMASPNLRNTATIGGNIVNASPAGDTLPSLYARNAVITISSSKTKENVKIENFIVSPGKTILKENELLTSIQVPNEKFDYSFYHKIGNRKSMSLSKISFVMLANISEGIVTDIRISIGAVAPRVVRSLELENKIIGLSLSKLESCTEKISNMYSDLCTPIDDQRSTADYRKKSAKALVEKYLNKIFISEQK